MRNVPRRRDEEWKLERKTMLARGWRAARELEKFLYQLSPFFVLPNSWCILQVKITAICKENKTHIWVLETFLARDMVLRLDRLRAAVEEEAMAREDVLIMVYAGICWGVMGNGDKRNREGKSKSSINVKKWRRPVKRSGEQKIPRRLDGRRQWRLGQFAALSRSLPRKTCSSSPRSVRCPLYKKH